ncbi:MFS transporter [Paenibacillus sp. JTLBN-2024]
MGWSLAILAFAQLIYSLDINIVFVALPEVGHALGFSKQSLQWVVSAYTIFAAASSSLAAAPRTGSGKKDVRLGAASVCAGVSARRAGLESARHHHGQGAPRHWSRVSFPATLSLINRLYEEGPRRNRALAVWGGAGASGLTLGSLLGGILTNAIGWEAVFFVNVLFAGGAALAALFVIPRDSARSGRSRFDLPGG